MKITKKQLLKIIREETEGVEKVRFSADNFGGGAAEDEPFVDVEEETLLNQNDHPGTVKDVLESRKIRVTKKQLVKMIREQAEGGGLPSVDDLAKKLSTAGAEAAIDFIQRLLAKTNFAAPPEVEVPEELPPPPPSPVVDEDV